MNKIFPSDWKWIKFNDLFQVAIGGTPSRSNPDYWDEEKKTKNKWVSIRDLKGKYIFDTSEYLSDLGVKNSNVKLVPKGTVMMSFKLTVGRTAYAGDNLFTNEAIAAFIPKKDNSISLGYFYQGLLFWNLLENSDQAVKGVTLNKEKINELQGLFPPLPEQQKIAAILTAVDEVIASTQAQISKLKDLKTAMMQELLTKGIGHTEFKDSAVGRIPATWECTTILKAEIKIIDGDRGSEYPKEADYFDFEYCLFLSAKNVTKSGFQFNQLVFITKEKDEKLRKGKLQRGDIVITTRGSVGNIAYFDETIPFENVRINSGMAIIRNNGEVFSSEFLNAVLHSRLVGEQIEALAFGSAQPQLTIGVIQDINLPVLPKEEQKQIFAVMDSIQKRLNLAESKMSLFNNAKKALMQDLLTGKVRVNV